VAANDPVGILSIAPSPGHHLSLGRAGAILSDKAQQGLVTLAGAASR